MKKILYIIPGWKSTSSEKPYVLLAKAAQEKDYKVVFKDIDWKKSLSSQIFTVPKDAVVFGFSLGAILAWLVAQKSACRLLILASMTPHYSFERSDIKKDLIDTTGHGLVDDVIAHLKPFNKAEKQITLYGDEEGELADILVPNTEHELTNNYIKKIKNIL